MFTATVSKHNFDDALHAMDPRIAARARATPCCLGEKSGASPVTGLEANVYWETLEALQSLMKHPYHLAAKRQQSGWLQGYHLMNAEVAGLHDDRAIAHPLRYGGARV